MDTTIFVQNIKKYCKQKGVPPTVACQESGVGKSFISNMVTRGSEPTLGKVIQLARYLEVTTSDLLGEENPAGDKTSGKTEEGLTISGFIDLTPERQELVRQHVALLLAEQQKD